MHHSDVGFVIPLLVIASAPSESSLLSPSLSSTCNSRCCFAASTATSTNRIGNIFSNYGGVWDDVLVDLRSQPHYTTHQAVCLTVPNSFKAFKLLVSG